MNKKAIQTIDKNGFWQMFEVIASPDCDIDTDVIAEALDKITNGSPQDREDGIEAIRVEISKYLPERLA